MNAETCWLPNLQQSFWTLVRTSTRLHAKEEGGLDLRRADPEADELGGSAHGVLGQVREQLQHAPRHGRRHSRRAARQNAQLHQRQQLWRFLHTPRPLTGLRMVHASTLCRQLLGLEHHTFLVEFSGHSELKLEGDNIKRLEDTERHSGAPFLTIFPPLRLLILSLSRSNSGYRALHVD